MARLVGEGLGVGMLPAAFAPRLPELRAVPIRDAPARTEHLVWSRFRPSPAAAAFLSALGVPDEALG
jgi:DNA-binding transcriptional LysR family regulator